MDQINEETFAFFKSRYRLRRSKPKCLTHLGFKNGSYRKGLEGLQT